MNQTDVILLLNEVAEELDRSIRLNGQLASAHEGYAVILEELDELKEQVWKKKRLRDKSLMRKEAIQVAAMGIKFALSLPRW